MISQKIVNIEWTKIRLSLRGHCVRAGKHLWLMLLEGGQLLLEEELLVLRVHLVHFAREGIVFINLLIEHQSDFVDLNKNGFKLECAFSLTILI